MLECFSTLDDDAIYAETDALHERVVHTSSFKGYGKSILYCKGNPFKKKSEKTWKWVRELFRLRKKLALGKVNLTPNTQDMIFKPKMDELTENNMLKDFLLMI